MFAIVDIETTGGHAAANGITEIAIVLHNGQETEGKYQTLVNPQMPIQKYVQSLTGITDQMVLTAPKFSEVAPHIFNLLKDRVFVAHNVNFDYSFVKHQLKQEGFELDTPKLCTIRLSRKIFPGLPKYGLGSICREMNIHINDRHRAAGDAIATTQLFEILMQHDTSGELRKMTSKRTVEQYIPPNIEDHKIKDLPYCPGVYYFLNKKEKVIYVGKAKNIKKRVTSHFSNNKPSKQKQEFLREIHDIRYKECSSEFIASVFESIEIKRLWPIYNKSQKHFERSYGIFMFEDALGYLRLGIDAQKKYLQPIASFHMIADAHRALWKLVNDFGLHPGLCFLDTSEDARTNLPAVEIYNNQILEAVASLKEQQNSYLIRDTSFHYILVENGRFYGMGQLEEGHSAYDMDGLKEKLTPYPENELIRNLVRQYAVQFPKSVIPL